MNHEQMLFNLRWRLTAAINAMTELLHIVDKLERYEASHSHEAPHYPPQESPSPWATPSASS